MKRSLFRVATVALVGSVVAALGVAGTASAAPNQYAPSIGTASSPTPTGSVAQAPRVVTTASCPVDTQFIQAYVDSTAAGLVKAQAIASNDADLANMTTSGVAFSFNFLDIAASQGKTLVNGRYELSVVCDPGLGQPPTAQFDAVFNITGGVGTGAGTTFAFEVAALPTTSTTLAVTPAGPVAQGASVTLTANVTSTVPVVGAVQFKSGATNIGAPVTVTGGAASLTTTALPPGANQSLTAVFTPAAPATTQGSTSNAVTFTVTAPAQATTLALTSSPASPTTADVVSLSAAVSSTTTVNTGTVTFLEGATTVGTANVSNGVASISLTGLSVGSHTYTANYAANASFLASTATVTLSVTAFTGVQASENITTTVNAGALTITAGGTVDLGPLALNADNTLLASSTTPAKSLQTVTVTDTRAGSLGWTVNGIVTEFSNGGLGKINSANLGWEPIVLTKGTGQTVNAGPLVAPGLGLAPGVVSAEGLQQSKQLASAPSGASIGTSTLTANLRLLAPTTTVAGVYNATLTLTAL